MERLTDKVRNYDGTSTSKQSLIVEEGLRAGTPSDYCSKIVTKLADYEDAEEQGLLLKLPCAIGTKVYNTIWWDDIHKKVEVDGETYYKTIHKHKVSESTFSLWDIKDFGKRVFLTREEAEQALKQMEGE